MTQPTNNQQTPANEPGANPRDVERINTANHFEAQLDARAAAFNAEIEPLLRQIAEIAQKNGVPFLAAFDITTADNLRVDSAFNMSVGCFLPDAPASDRLRQAIAILRPRTREEQEEENERINSLAAALAKSGIVMPGVTAPDGGDDHEGSTPD